MNETLKKKLTITMIIVTFIIVILGITLILLSKNTNNYYKDYNLYNETTNKIIKYNKSNAIEGYKGGEKAYYIIGNISSNKNQGFTVITYNLYDKKNNLLGEAVGVLDKLEKNKKHKYKVVSLIEESKINSIDHYKIKTIETK